MHSFDVFYLRRLQSSALSVEKKNVPKSFGEAVSSASLIVRIIQIVERLRRIFSSLDQLGVCELKEAVNYMNVLSN